MCRLPISFHQKGMIGFVLLKHAKQNFTAPTQLLPFPSPAWQIAWHHQTGLDNAAKLPLHQLRSAQRALQILFRAPAFKTKPPLFQRHFLKWPQRQQKSIIVDRDQGVSSDPVFHAPGRDTRKRVVGAATDKRMKEIMQTLAVAIKFDQHLLPNRNFRDMHLGAKLLDNGFCICVGDIVVLHQPIHWILADRPSGCHGKQAPPLFAHTRHAGNTSAMTAVFQLLREFRSQLAHGASHAGSERHLRCVPPRHGGQLTVRTFDEHFVDSRID